MLGMAKSKTKKVAKVAKKPLAKKTAAKKPATAKRTSGVAKRSARAAATSGAKANAKASAKKKATAFDETSIEATTEARFNWPDVTRRIGAPSNDDIGLYAVRETPTDLVERGRQIRSEKILTDYLRWLGQIADDLAHAGASKTIPGFSLGMLRVAASDGQRLRNVTQELETSSGSRAAEDASTSGDAKAQFELGLGRRDALRAALRVAAENAAGRDKVAVAYGTAKNATKLKTALNALVAIARSWMKSGGNAAERLEAGGVTSALLAETERLARTIQDTGDRASGARTTSEVSQRDLDIQDGICLVHMEHLIEMFGVAYASNPTVPHLVPIATRSYFGHRSAKAGDDQGSSGGGDSPPGSQPGATAPGVAAPVVDEDRRTPVRT
jgi:hypothetical protein